jgi:hypothetical protein
LTRQQLVEIATTDKRTHGTQIIDDAVLWGTNEAGAVPFENFYFFFRKTFSNDRLAILDLVTTFIEKIPITKG